MHGNKAIIQSRIWVARFKKLIILTVLKHSGKIPLDNELLNSIETAWEIGGAKILYMISEKISISEWKAEKLILHRCSFKINGEVCE